MSSSALLAVLALATLPILIQADPSVLIYTRTAGTYSPEPDFDLTDGAEKGALLLSSELTSPASLDATGFRHDSIPTAIEAFKQQGPEYGISFTFSEDPSIFSDDGLNSFDAIGFVSNSDEGTLLRPAVSCKTVNSPGADPCSFVS